MLWTDDQQKAISARDGTLLVSAAAGSGKTAVLVEREVAQNTPADRLLIVTFTKAATAQMREKISDALQKRIREDPTNEHLLRQQALLPFAHISTIDSFCGDVVRENFQRLGVEPDFRILDEHALHVMQEETVAEVVEQLYAEDDGTFSELCELLFRGRDDRKLVETIMELDTVASSYAEPEQWLRGLYTDYDPSVPLGETRWGTLAREIACRIVRTCIDSVTHAEAIIQSDADVLAKYAPFLTEERTALERLAQKLRDEQDWDALRETALSAADFLPPRAPTVRGNDSYEKNAAHQAHTMNKDRLKKQLPLLFCSTAAEYAQDAAYCLPLIRCLSEAALRYRQALLEKKKAANSYDFSDVSLFALRCLEDENGEKTDYARELSESFREILVDEFQDVNGAQYRLFSLLSRDGENLFMVGDAKQSIYKFRQARPDIFIRLKEQYPLYEDGNYPALVQLDCNFRSRENVTGWVNFVFRQIMYSSGERLFEVNYDEREYLRARAEYPPTETPDAQLHVVRIDRNADDRIVAEARYVAEWIQGSIDAKLMVTENGALRPAKLRDFCILVRSDAGRIAKIADTLAQYGIPALAGSQGGLFDAPEVRFLLSLLQTLDNPTQDVPLLAVMLSPVFGFTADDLSALRVDDREAGLYALVCAAAKTQKRYAAFLDTLADLRMLAAALSAPELVRRLLDETGYGAVVLAMTDGEGRQANLRMIEQLAGQYEQSGKFGLSGFVRFLERMQQRDKTEKARVQYPLADAVQIMTIHRSKGLEFPVCILMNCSGPFNGEEYNNNYIYHNEYGMATVRRDSASFIQYDTVPKRVLNVKVRETNVNEELRILYVAMTRAKEKLIAVCSLEDPAKRLTTLSLRAGVSGTIDGLFELNSYGDMLLAACLRHPDAHALREEAGIPARGVMLDADFPLYVQIADAPQQVVTAPADVPLRAPDSRTLSQIEARTDYVYPYAALSAATAKHAASELEDGGIDEAFFASARPAFLASGGLTPAQRGTALHRFMQLSDYARAADDAAAELARLTSEGAFTKQESAAVPIDSVRRFFDSDLGRRILRADTLLREKRFAVETPLSSLYPELSQIGEGETVVIQGMVDCAFVENGKLIIVDYKTDREPPETLRERYRSQLETYCTAMRLCTDFEIGGAYLYSFHNHCRIDMNDR